MRQTGGGNVTIAPNKAEAITIKMRYTRTAGANSVVGPVPGHRPGAVANADWVNFPATTAAWNNTGGLQLNPTGQTRRDAPGSRIGIISAGNFPGTTGNHPYTGHAGRREGRLLPGHPGQLPDRRGPDGADDDRHGGAGGPERHQRLVHVGRQRHPRG